VANIWGRVFPGPALESPCPIRLIYFSWGVGKHYIGPVDPVGRHYIVPVCHEAGSWP